MELRKFLYNNALSMNQGIDYLVKAVELVKEKKAPIIMSRDIYPIVAKEFNVSSNVVMKEIRKIIKSIGGHSLAKIGYHGKPTNNAFIYHIAFAGDKIWRAWTITSQFICGKMMYAVCRVKDVSKPVHSGNLEFATGYIESKAEAEKIANNLNGGKLNV